MPKTSGESFPAFWSSDANNAWTSERDFFEVHPDWQPGGYTTDLAYVLDADWIYSTHPLLQDLYKTNAVTQLGFDPSARMHTYDYEIYPSGAWSFFIDGKKQMWIGNGSGIAPAEHSTGALQQLRLNYATTANTLHTTRSLRIDYVAVYEDAATAGLAGHPYSSGVAIAPGTAVTGG